MRKLLLITICILQIITMFSMVSSTSKHREKRTLPFTKGSAFGYLVAVAVPIDTISQNVFLSFNFESNFALPNNNTHTDFIDKWNIDEETNFDSNNVTTITRRSLSQIYTRRNFYKTVEGHLHNMGFNGTGCLLRTICEINEMPISENNGLLGTLLHILLSPSTSSQEEISSEYYQAEEFGLKNKCSFYYKQCSVNILDMISNIF